MSKVILGGEVHLGADGVLQGWCWNPQRPSDRLILEILIDERVVSTLVASRFREDLRGREIGDGYYGFIVTLTKSLLDAGDDYVVSARERESGCCFWRQVRGESGLPSDFADRFTHAQYGLSRAERSSRFRTLGTSSLASRVSTELGVLGRYLQMGTRHSSQYLPPIARARSALLQRTASVILEKFQCPKVAVIIVADATSNDALSTITALVPTLASMEASLLLIDRGSNIDIALAPSLFANLGYVFDARADLGSLLADVLKYSRGDLLIVARNPGREIVQALPEIVAQMHDSGSVYINAQMAKIACAIGAESFEDMCRQTANFPIGLEVAGRRGVFERLRDCLQSNDGLTRHATVDLAVRAMRDGIDCCAWDESNAENTGGLGVEAAH